MDRDAGRTAAGDADRYSVVTAMNARGLFETAADPEVLDRAVAAAAMAQDELGNARSFYPLLRGFPRGLDTRRMEEKGWQQRPTAAMTCLDRPFGKWCDFLAANLVVDTALTTLLSAATESPCEALRQRARKIQQEESAHWVHAAGWLRRLQPADADMGAALARVWDDALTWFGQADDPILAPLVEAGLLGDGPDGLRDTLRARLEALLSAAGAETVLARDLPWDRWDPAARRFERASYRQPMSEVTSGDMTGAEVKLRAAFAIAIS